jgi:hypothetical protein
MIRQNAGHHGLTDRNGPDPDAGIMTTTGHDFYLFSLTRH